MATVPEIPALRVAVREEEAATDAAAIGSGPAWAPVEVPRAQRPSSIVLAVLGAIAGVAAMALGAFAVVTASSSPEVAELPASVPPTAPAVEGRVLSLLAKPSTERIVFTGSGGRLVLAVGSGGRAAILIRGLQRPKAAKPLSAWVLAPGAGPLRAARFVGTERAVLLSVPVGPKARIVVSTARPARGRTGPSAVAASRG